MKKIYSLFIILITLCACTDERDIVSLDGISAPTNVDVVYNITQDNTGLVSMKPTAEGVSGFSIDFGDGTAATTEVINSGETVTHIYKEGVYDVVVKAFNLKGDETTITKELVVSFKAPENLEIETVIDDINTLILNVSATADFATSFLVFFDTSDEDAEGVPLANDGVVSFEYPIEGDYTIKVVALSGGEETSELEQVISVVEPSELTTELPIDFEIFDESVFEGFGGASNMIVDNPYMNGNASGKVAKIIKDAPELWAGNSIELSSPIDFSNERLITMNVWSPRPGGKLILKLEKIDDQDVKIEKEITTVGNSEWETVTFDFSDIDESIEYQKLVFFFDLDTIGDGTDDWTFYIDNILLGINQVSSFDGGLLNNGDFESGSNSWLEGVDDNSSVPVVTENGNSFYSVNVETAGDPFGVNMSQKVEIIQGNEYLLTFDAWSDQDRTIISGIGLSVDPFSSFTEEVTITNSKETYSLVLSAESFGAIDARVIFDLGADVGEVNIDNVSLKIKGDNLITNNDFESGSDSWIEGVDDNSSVPVVTESDNSFYSVNVETAGNPWEVNMSQKLEIIQGNTYTLTFDAWSDQDRTIFSGIGLSVDPFSSSTEEVTITNSKKTYSLVLSAEDFGAIDARVIFDLGADVGEVNIDNVYLSIN